MQGSKNFATQTKPTEVKTKVRAGLFIWTYFIVYDGKWKFLLSCLNLSTFFLIFALEPQVPLSLFGGSGNYASALFLAASKANILDKVESEILDVVEASKRSPVFSQFIKDLSVPKGTRVKAINEIFSEAGFSDVTKNFLGMLYYMIAHKFLYGISW